MYSQCQAARNTPTSTSTSHPDNLALDTWHLLGIPVHASCLVQNITGPKHLPKRCSSHVTSPLPYRTAPLVLYQSSIPTCAIYRDRQSMCLLVLGHRTDTATCCYITPRIMLSIPHAHGSKRRPEYLPLLLPPTMAPALLGIRMGHPRLPRYHMTDRSSALCFGSDARSCEALFTAVSRAAELVPSPWVICFTYFERARDWQPGSPCTTNRRRLRSHFSLPKS